MLIVILSFALTCIILNIANYPISTNFLTVALTIIITIIIGSILECVTQKHVINRYKSITNNAEFNDENLEDQLSTNIMMVFLDVLYYLAVAYISLKMYINYDAKVYIFSDLIKPIIVLVIFYIIFLAYCYNLMENDIIATFQLAIYQEVRLLTKAMIGIATVLSVLVFASLVATVLIFGVLGACDIIGGDD